MSFDLEVNLRKPTRLLTRAWETFLEVGAKNVRGREFSGCYYDPYANCVMLNPLVDPGNWLYGKNGYNLYIWNGASWAFNSDVWVDGEAAHGDAGHYIGFAGNASWPATTPWAAFYGSSLPTAENDPLFFEFNWTPPTGNFQPRLEFWPRVDFSKVATINGFPYYFSPIGFYIDTQTANLVVCEYEYDSYDKFEEDPANMLKPTYQHPLNLGAMGLTGGWISFKLLPVIEEWTNPTDSLTYYRHDFVLQSPILDGGGFCYRTKVDRTYTSLFPEGNPGIRSLTGGVCALTIAPIYFESSGYVLSQTFSKREDDIVYPSTTTDAYLPSGSAITNTIVYPESYPTPTTIPSGDQFQQFKIKSALSATSGEKQSPILYSVKPAITGAAEDIVQIDTDVSSDVFSLRESMSEDLIGYRATLTLRNPEGTYNSLVYRQMHEVEFKLGGVARAIIYTNDPSFEWYQTPTQEALFITWECGDFWERLKRQYVSGFPDYGGQSIKAAITDYFTRLGFDPTKLHIADSLDLVYLPRSFGKDDPLYKPQDGSTADEFVADLHEKWFSTYPTGFDGVGDFWISEPVDPNDPANIFRTYYLSVDDAETAYAAGGGDYNDYTFMCQKPQVTWLHSQHFNEIVVWGEDPATKEPICSMWLDKASQYPTEPYYEDYVNYVGERRILWAVTRFPTQYYVDRYRAELVKFFGTIRRQISFTTKYDPYLQPGHFIKFYGLGMVFVVTSTDVDIASQNVVRSGPNPAQNYDNDVRGCKIEAVQWPLL